MQQVMSRLSFLLKESAAIVGASLGKIAGTGQTRHSVASLKNAVQSAKSLFPEFQLVGLPFLERYSSPVTTLSVLQSGGSEALLISPLTEFQHAQIQALQSLGAPSNNSFKPNPLRGFKTPPEFSGGSA
jgi:hypothetical protein